MAELLCSVQFPFQRCCTRWNLRSHNLSQPPRGVGGLLQPCPVRQQLMCDPKLRNRKNKKPRWRSDNWRRQEPNKNEEKSERCVSRCSYPWAPRRAVFRRLHLSRLRSVSSCCHSSSCHSSCCHSGSQFFCPFQDLVFVSFSSYPKPWTEPWWPD